ncbi:Transcriptional regulatory protein ZraR [Syntrophobacter sp. SbD1]|nr:Transcriptional regulatory protein ZraR [Syntrophobacter sp. SbD1]
MKFSTRILIVDDEEMICESLQAWFVRDGYQVETALSGEAALKIVENSPADIYLVDIKMPHMDGIEFLTRLKECQPNAIVVMMTAHGTVQTAVEAMKRGAMDYFCKPFDPDELSLFMERILANKALREENNTLKELLSESNQQGLSEVFIVHSEPMRAIFSKIEEVAPSSAPILITGETGVGKDMVAKAIHFRSERSCGPFLAVNCGSLSESILESELFGHEKGAFTGAVKARRGRLEMAHNGTLFLDEVGEISQKMQVSLLRAIEEKSFLRLGGSQPISSDFRLISATHRDLPSLIKEKQFRDDFYYRINVITIDVPPLRERLDDIPVLADHFLKRYAEETGKSLGGFTHKAIDLLSSYHWPGNIRELRNVVERAVVIARGRMIGAEELTFVNPRHDAGLIGSATLRELEINQIKAALESCNWNIVRSSKRLGIDRSTLMRKMKRYRLDRC